MPTSDLMESMIKAGTTHSDEDVIAFGRFAEIYLDKHNQAHMTEVISLWNMC